MATLKLPRPTLLKESRWLVPGQLPKFGEDMYHTDADDLFSGSNRRSSVTNLHRDEIIEPGKLPFNYVCYTACFRREAGSAGKDTRGVIRVHQFDKVELVKFVEPSTSYEEQERLTANAEEVLRRLEIPYQLKMMCTGDLGFAAAKIRSGSLVSGTRKICRNFFLQQL